MPFHNKIKVHRVSKLLNIQIYETSSFIFIEMEIIRGGSLKQLMKQKKNFSDHEASIIIKGLLSAVEHVH